MSPVPLLLKISSLSPARVVASALTPVRISGPAADCTARSGWAESRSLVEITAPVTGWSLVSFTVPDSPASPVTRSRCPCSPAPTR